MGAFNQPAEFIGVICRALGIPACEKRLASGLVVHGSAIRCCLLKAARIQVQIEYGAHASRMSKQDLDAFFPTPLILDGQKGFVQPLAPDPYRKKSFSSLVSPVIA